MSAPSDIEEQLRLQLAHAVAERDQALAERDYFVAAHTQTAVMRDREVAAHAQTAMERDQAVAAHTQAVIERDQEAAAHTQTYVERDQFAAERDKLAAERTQITVRDATLLKNHDELREKLRIFVESYKNIIRTVTKITMEDSLSVAGRNATNKMLMDMAGTVRRVTADIKAEEKKLHQVADKIKEDLKELNKKEMVLGLQVMHM